MTTIQKMTTKELRAYIDGCWVTKQYDTFFERVAQELNNRRDAEMERNLENILKGGN